MGALAAILLVLAQADGGVPAGVPAPGEAPLPTEPLVRRPANSFEGFGRTPRRRRCWRS